MPQTPDNDLSRFLKKLPPRPIDGCWEWLGGLTHGGYAAFNAGGKRIDGHRFSYGAYRGIIPKGMHVCHTCDNPKCVNPLHLFVGTHSDNMKDAFRKGRIFPPRRKPSGRPRKSRAVENPNRRPGAKITADMARKIKDRLIAGETGRALAREHGIHFATISDIRRGLTWRDI